MEFGQVGQVSRYTFYKDDNRRTVNPMEGRVTHGIILGDVYEFNRSFPINDKYYKQDYIVNGTCDLLIDSYARLNEGCIVFLYTTDVIETDTIDELRESCKGQPIGTEVKHTQTGRYVYDYEKTFDVVVTFVKIRFGLSIKNIHCAIPVELCSDWIEKFNNYRVQIRNT